MTMERFCASSMPDLRPAWAWLVSNTAPPAPTIGVLCSGKKRARTRARRSAMIRAGDNRRSRDLGPARIDDHDTAMRAGMEHRCSYIVRRLPPRRAKKERIVQPG